MLVFLTVLSPYQEAVAADAKKPAAKPAAKPAVKKAPAKKPAATPRKPAVKAAPAKAKPKAPVRRKVQAPSAEPEATPAPPQKPISTICIDADTGIVLSESNADIPRPPASMIKLMLMLMVVEGVEAGKWKLDTPITVSERAQGMGGTQVLVKAGDVWPLEHLMLGIAVASANDAAMAVAEALWGSEAEYLKAANARAIELGMKNTAIHGVHGLPPDKGEDFDQSTARDMATLGRYCYKKPKIMEWVATREYQLRETSAVHSSTNKLMWRMPGCDGMKTGFIRAAGFCITATAKRDDTRLISVVMGHPDKYGRFNDAEALLNQGFLMFRKILLVKKGAAIETAVPSEACLMKGFKLVAGEDIWVKMNLANLKDVKYSAVLPDNVSPPVQSGAELGKLIVRLNGEKIGETPLVAPQDLSICGWTAETKPGEQPVWNAPPPPKRGFFRWRK